MFKWKVFLVIWGEGLFVSSLFSNMIALCFSHSFRLCFWQLATSVHSIRVQRSATKAFCRGTTGHSDYSCSHEWPEPRGAFQIRKGWQSSFVAAQRKSHPRSLGRLHWSTDQTSISENDFLRVKDEIMHVWKEWMVSFLSKACFIFYVKHIIQLTYKALRGLEIFLRVLNCLFRYTETHIIPWSIEILGGELLSDQVTFDLALLCSAFSTETLRKAVS